MKNIFGIDVTTDKYNSSLDGECFIARQLSDATEKKWNELVNSDMNFKTEASLPLFLEIINIICYFVGFVILIAVIETGFNIKMIVDNNAAYFLYIDVIAWVTVIYLTICKKKKLKTVSESEEFEKHMKNVDKMMTVAMSELGIPEDSKSIDVIAVKYKYKNGEMKYVNFHPMFNTMNFDMFAFADKDMFCLADPYNVYEIPLSSIKQVEPCKKRMMIPEWHKEETFNSPTYKQYKITMNSQSTYFTYCYKVTIDDTKGQFELIIPNYDMPTFSEITGVNINK